MEIENCKFRALKHECIVRTRILDSRQPKRLEETFEFSYQFFKCQPQNSSVNVQLQEEEGKTDQEVQKASDSLNVEDYATSENIKQAHSNDDLALANVFIGYHINNHDPLRSLMRYTHNEQLHGFVSNLKWSDWKKIKEKVFELALVVIAQVRKKLSSRQVSLNSRKIFHPNANQVRMEAKLQIELRRLLKYDALEQSIIQQLFTSTQQKGPELIFSPHDNSSNVDIQLAAEPEGVHRGIEEVKCVVNKASRSNISVPSKEHEITKDGIRLSDEGMMSLNEFQKCKGKSKRIENDNKMPGPLDIDEYMKNRIFGNKNRMINLRKKWEYPPIGENIINTECLGGGQKGKLAESKTKYENVSVARPRDLEGECSIPLSSVHNDHDSDSDSDSDSSDDKDENGNVRMQENCPDSHIRMKPDIKQKTSSSANKNPIEDKTGGGTLVEKIGKIFENLEMPSAQKLKFMIKYSSRQSQASFHHVVKDWYAVSKLVLITEHLLRHLRSESSKNLEPDRVFSPRQERLLQKCKCYVSTAQMFGSSTSTWLKVIFTKLLVYLELVLKKIEEKWGDTITFRGHRYYKDRIRPLIEAGEEWYNNKQLLKPLSAQGRGSAITLLSD